MSRLSIGDVEQVEIAAIDPITASSSIGDSIGIYGTADTVSGLPASEVYAPSAAQANSLVSAMGAFAPPTAGQISVLASAQQPTAVILAAAH